LADRRIKASRQEWREAPHGRLTDLHRFFLGLYLKQYDGLDTSIAAIDRRVDALVARLDEEAKAQTQVLAQEQAGQCPFRSLIELLCTIPGISVLGATMILSEIRPRHEPLSDGGPSRRLGGFVPRSERERRQSGACARAGR
jgi:transposase